MINRGVKLWKACRAKIKYEPGLHDAMRQLRFRVRILLGSGGRGRSPD